MAALRVEADESAATAEEMKTRVKTLEQANLSKDQEIQSLSHKNQLLEAEVDKLETGVKEAKKMAEESGMSSRESESLQRKLQVLEEEAEAADSNLRDTNEKYVFSTIYYLKTCPPTLPCDFPAAAHLKPVTDVLLSSPGSVKQMSKPVTTSAKCRLSRLNAISGSRSTRKWRRSTTRQRTSSSSSWPRLATFERKGASLRGTFTFWSLFGVGYYKTSGALFALCGLVGDMTDILW